MTLEQDSWPLVNYPFVVLNTSFATLDALLIAAPLHKKAKSLLRFALLYLQAPMCAPQAADFSPVTALIIILEQFIMPYL